MTRQQAGPRGLEQRVLARWRQVSTEQVPQPAGDARPVIVGFSGGGDSLALAAVLGKIRPLGGPDPILTHVDHGWRADSGAEQDRAAALASSLGFAFRACRVPDDSRDRHPGVGREEAARRDRYLLLAEAAREAGTDLIALAHHRDDQAETVLLHLARGAGLAGAAGMAAFRRVPVPWWTGGREGTGDDVALWRPFLAEPRAVVRAYAAATGLAAIEDPSNEDTGYRRNAIRTEVLPALERIVPGATAALARFAGLAADDDEALTAIADERYGDAVTDAGELRRSVVLAAPRAVGRRLMRRWARSVCGLPVVSAERTDAMLALLADGEPGRWLEIGEGVTVVVTRTGLRLGESVDFNQ